MHLFWWHKWLAQPSRRLTLSLHIRLKRCTPTSLLLWRPESGSWKVTLCLPYELVLLLFFQFHSRHPLLVSRTHLLNSRPQILSQSPTSSNCNGMTTHRWYIITITALVVVVCNNSRGTGAVKAVVVVVVMQQQSAVHTTVMSHPFVCSALLCSADDALPPYWSVV